MYVCIVNYNSQPIRIKDRTYLFYKQKHFLGRPLKLWNAAQHKLLISGQLFKWSDVQSWTKGQPHNTNGAADLFGWNRRNWRYWSVWLLRGSNILLCWCNFVGVTETKCGCKWFLKAVCHLNHMAYFWIRTFTPFENNLIMLLYIQNDSKLYVCTLDAEKRVMSCESGNAQDRISQSVIIHFW